MNGKAAEKLLPRLADHYRRLVENLAGTLESVNISKARAELRSLLGEIRIDVDEHEARSWSSKPE